MVQLLECDDLKDLLDRGDVVWIDARSEGEYEHAHIPHAHNIPLLHNEARHQVGICYKEHGQQAAIDLGFELVGHLFNSYIERARDLAKGKPVVVYCWRGGLRSDILSWLFANAGLNTYKINGGYKKYRNLVLKTITTPRQWVVLGGKTGVGKTSLLDQIEISGEPVIQLEYLANHKGSSFGALGQPPQPSMEQFENLLAEKLVHIEDAPIWIEDESRWIGSVKVPDSIFQKMLHSPIIILERHRKLRIKRILSEYGLFPVQELIYRTCLLKKRLGGDRLQEALHHLESGELELWIETLLPYYDKTYQYNIELREAERLKSIDTGWMEDEHEIAVMLIRAKNELCRN